MAGNRGKQIKTSAEETKEENIEWNKRFLVYNNTRRNN